MWERVEKGNVIYYTLPEWAAQGAQVIMTTRVGGVSEAPYEGLNLGLHVGDDSSAVIANRRLLLDANRWREGAFVTAKQVHGDGVLYVDASFGGRGFSDYESAIDDTDGLFTAERDLVLATFYADCLPLAVFHPTLKLLGLAHAGWQGTYRNIGAALIGAMGAKWDFEPEELWCATGAAIGPCCYQVDADFYQRFLERYPDSDPWFSAGEKGKYRFNNEKANVALLQKAGVKRENISVLGLCTACHDDLFFSYRKGAGKTGRHGLWGALI
ncbi:MAG TPA: peptidoglycan editing factor PgeF [Clostridiales bacterium]|nr:peptidoglycan editing factor PgeF [Clostridiales bacterium]